MPPADFAWVDTKSLPLQIFRTCRFWCPQIFDFRGACRFCARRFSAQRFRRFAHKFRGHPWLAAASTVTCEQCAPRTGRRSPTTARRAACTTPLSSNWSSGTSTVMPRPRRSFGSARLAAFVLASIMQRVREERLGLVVGGPGDVEVLKVSAARVLDGRKSAHAKSAHAKSTQAAVSKYL